MLAIDGRIRQSELALQGDRFGSYIRSFPAILIRYRIGEGVGEKARSQGCKEKAHFRYLVRKKDAHKKKRSERIGIIQIGKWDT